MLCNQVMIEFVFSLKLSATDLALEEHSDVYFIYMSSEVNNPFVTKGTFAAAIGISEVMYGLKPK